jgi:predicted Zn finger-like uncharacterized protein
MTASCPKCSAQSCRILVSHERSYGRYRLFKCGGCNHRWNIKTTDPSKRPQATRSGFAACPECGSTRTRTTESRVSGAYRHRRIECRDCDHRWSTRDDAANRFCLSEDQVRRSLESPASHRALAEDLAAELGDPSRAAALTRQIGYARSGANFGHLFPELRPWVAASCEQCRHWCGERCGVGFPDPLHEGARFAADCAAFVR